MEHYAACSTAGIPDIGTIIELQGRTVQTVFLHRLVHVKFARQCAVTVERKRFGRVLIAHSPPVGMCIQCGCCFHLGLWCISFIYAHYHKLFIYAEYSPITVHINEISTARQV